MDDILGMVQALGDRLPEGFAADVFKSLLGTLIGAGVAFWFALRKDAATREREQRAAGNAAITTLAGMTSDFVQVRFAIAQTRKAALALEPNAPVWMHVKPLPFRHGDTLRFDTKAITYIFDHPDGPEVFNKIMTVEIKYHAFFHLLQEHRKTSEESQNLLAEKYPDPTKSPTVSECVRALGVARVARMESLAAGIFMHVDGDEPAYRDAADALPKLLKSIFKKGVVRLAPATEEELERTLGDG
jgi:hypothetical protein